MQGEAMRDFRGFYVTAEQDAKIRALAAGWRVSMSEAMRRLIDDAPEARVIVERQPAEQRARA